MNRIIGVTLGGMFPLLEKTSEVMWEHIRIRILEDRFIEVDIEEIIGMRIMTEVGEGLGKGNIKVILDRTTEVAVIFWDQDQEQVLIGIE